MGVEQELREQVARAMHKVDRIKDVSDWEHLSAGDKWAYLTMADVAITTLAKTKEKNIVVDG